jgi:ubiquinone/menaquinone biosynthesis C-methylase UbiE
MQSTTVPDINAQAPSSVSSPKLKRKRSQELDQPTKNPSEHPPSFQSVNEETPASLPIIPDHSIIPSSERLYSHQEQVSEPQNVEFPGGHGGNILQAQQAEFQEVQPEHPSVQKAAEQGESSQQVPYNDSAVHSLNDTGDEQEVTRDEEGDNFSNYGSEDSASFYSSLLSYATDYYWENGRRYHAHQGGRYMLPNDEVELDREDMKHHEFMLITDFKLHLSPIGDNPQRILDLGTGTGIWAMQIAELYPSAEIIGTDISPVQPKWVPPNLTFEVDDLEAEWLYRPGSYDLIHIRFMFLAIKDYPAVLAQVYRTLKPGGYIELSELATLPTSTNPNYPSPVTIYRWLDLLAEASTRMGFTMRIAPTFKELLTNAGFVDVVETKFDVPWGTWPEDKRMKAVGFWHLGLCFVKEHGVSVLTLYRATQARPSGYCYGPLLAGAGLDASANRGIPC